MHTKQEPPVPWGQLEVGDNLSKALSWFIPHRDLGYRLLSGLNFIQKHHNSGSWRWVPPQGWVTARGTPPGNTRGVGHSQTHPQQLRRRESFPLPTVCCMQPVSAGPGWSRARSCSAPFQVKQFILPWYHISPCQAQLLPSYLPKHLSSIPEHISLHAYTLLKHCKAMVWADFLIPNLQKNE